MNQKEKFRLNVSKSHKMLRQLMKPLCVRIMYLIEKNEGLNQIDIMIGLRDKEQCVISTNIKLLKRAGVVRCERNGKELRHFLVRERIEEINGILSKFQ